MRIPVATYRIQFNPSFGFQEAREIIPLLSQLGISDLYASPIFKARKGSKHGYDVVDPTQLNPELGTKKDFDELIEASKEKGLGWLQDIVPNHMAFDHENQVLADILENGEASQFYHFFDVEWDHHNESIRGRLLAPFLGAFFGEALEKGEIAVSYDVNGLRINYYEMSFPLRVESYAKVLSQGLSKLKRTIGREHPDFIKLLGIIYVLKNLPAGDENQERYDQVTFAKRLLWELYSGNEAIKRYMDESLEAFSPKKRGHEGLRLLDDLLSEQLFRLSFWKVATEEINYRRFFNINNLISLRVEKEEVLTNTHSLIFNLIREGKFSGLRVDHIDGLYDPTKYLRTLRAQAGEVYLVVEKILDFEEDLPLFWPLQGTTGYDFLNYVNGVFCKSDNERKFTRIYSAFTGLKPDYAALVSDKKRLIMGKHMAGDIDNLAHHLRRISSRDPYASDITLYGLKRALVEVMAFFPVYRTYTSAHDSREADCEYIKAAVMRARQSNPGLTHELRFIEKFLLLEFNEYLSDEEKGEWMQFVMRFQQFTGPLMAKGFEDTTLYVYNRLLSLNDVGGSPEKFGISLKQFEAFATQRGNLWPHSMNATSTHDTKRGEDVRARINVLSEMPDEWERNLKLWTRINKGGKQKVKGMNVPDRNDEYFLYQTLVGAFPFDKGECGEFVDRIKGYVIKAVREAKVHTEWLKPDLDYEHAYLSFVDQILSPSESNPFLREFLPFQKKVAHFGTFNSLSQTLIKIACPGVPDFYQGTELWDLNLVDPDNRRPVDFEKRTALLREIMERSKADILSLIEELLCTKEDGRVKLFLIYEGLKARKENIQLFQNGMYRHLEITGKFKDHVIAFARRHESDWGLAIAPRFLTGLVSEEEFPTGRKSWGDTRIVISEEMPKCWRETITGKKLEVEGELFIGDALEFFPAALILSEEGR